MKEVLKPTLEDRIDRIEVLLDLKSPPVEWNITAERVKNVRKEESLSMQEAIKSLVCDFGRERLYEPYKNVDPEYYGIDK